MHKFELQIQTLIDGHCRVLCLHDNGNLVPYQEYESYATYAHGSYYIIPTAANPLHKGHLHMANHVEAIREFDGTDVEFELSIANVDKDNLSVKEVCDRLQQFMQLGRKCWITNFATFAQKAHFFQGCTFVIGTDTANRIVDPAYYFDCEEERDKVIYDISGKDCCFMVLGRPGHTLDEEVIKRSEMFFREDYDGHDISSTKIREDAKVSDGAYRDKSYDLPQKPILYNPDKPIF